MMVVGDDVWVVELRNHLHLVNDVCLTGGIVAVQLLDGNKPMRNFLAGEEYCAEATFPQLLFESIDIVEDFGHGIGQVKLHALSGGFGHYEAIFQLNGQKQLGEL